MTDRRRGAVPGPSAQGHCEARPRAGLVVFLFLLAGLGGCASTPQSRALLDRPPPTLAPRAELVSTPFHPQKRYQCGPAALATMLEHAGHPTRPETLVDEVYIPEREGTLRTEIRAATRARGLVPYPLAPRLEDLLREVDDGRPVLVMQNLGLDWLPQWHFAVLVGYELERGEVVLRSGTQRRRLTSMPVFERTWARSGRWAQVIVPADRIPATAEPVPWLQAIRELEPTHPETALRGYRSATERWPGSAEAWMAYGNAAYADRDAETARDAFTAAIRARPEATVGWNNLAYALAASGCHPAAVRAAQCAVDLAPDDPETGDTLREIRSLSAPDQADQCPIPACPVRE